MGFKKYFLLKILLTLLFFSCSSNRFHKYPNKAPVREDHDQKKFSKLPESHYSPKLWDFFDKTFVRPMTHFFLLETDNEAKNVNSVDEVPNSSWFRNRKGSREISTRELAKGSCEKIKTEIKAPWSVISGKPDGANPGFMIEDESGRRFMLKFDDLREPEIATAADVIGSRIYHAAGYNAPCNKIVYFNPDILKISPEANKKNKLGEKVKMTDADIKEALKNTRKTSSGKLRATMSQFLPGKPLGPFRYHGTREDDYNDVIDHEDRRELRGAKVLASWVNHFDSRSQNSLDIWVSSKNSNKGYVKHYYLDFGDSFGSTWDWDGVSRRHGHSYYMDPGDIMQDLFTFGFKERPWHKRTYGRTGEILGYYDVDHFEPGHWKPGYPNPAFEKGV